MRAKHFLGHCSRTSPTAAVTPVTSPRHRPADGRVTSVSKSMICVSPISVALREAILISSLQHKKDALYGGHIRASAANTVHKPLHKIILQFNVGD
jgi:hypothetical protein